MDGENKYRCSFCGETVTEDTVEEHLAEDRQKLGWSGVTTLTLIGGSFDTETPEDS
jgi:hypothetical protein